LKKLDLHNMASLEANADPVQKKSEANLSEEHTAFLVVQDRHGGGLIGRRGASINELRENARCKITLQDRKLKFLSRRPVRALKLRGTLEQVTTAIRLVTIKLKTVQADNIAHKSARSIHDVLEGMNDDDAAHELTLLTPQGLISNDLVEDAARTNGLNINVTPISNHFDLIDFSGDAEPISRACKSMLEIVWFEHGGEIHESQLNDYGTQGPGVMPHLMGGGGGQPHLGLGPNMPPLGGMAWPGQYARGGFARNQILEAWPWAPHRNTQTTPTSVLGSYLESLNALAGDQHRDIFYPGKQVPGFGGGFRGRGGARWTPY